MGMTTTRGALTVAAAMLLAGCTSSGSPFSNPFGSAPPPRPLPAPPPQQLPVVPTPLPPAAGGRPSVVVNASPKRVQDTIIARAQRRGTTILGANQTGVTLEIPLRQSSEIVTQQCGEHRDNRTLRVYLETLPNGSGTTVSEDRYVVDGGQSSCQLRLTQNDVEDANKSLADLKQQAESPSTATNTRPSNSPPGRVEPLNPGRPVVPVR